MFTCSFSSSIARQNLTIRYARPQTHERLQVLIRLLNSREFAVSRQVENGKKKKTTGSSAKRRKTGGDKSKRKSTKSATAAAAEKEKEDGDDDAGEEEEIDVQPKKRNRSDGRKQQEEEEEEEEEYHFDDADNVVVEEENSSNIESVIVEEQKPADHKSEEEQEGAQRRKSKRLVSQNAAKPDSDEEEDKDFVVDASSEEDDYEAPKKPKRKSAPKRKLKRISPEEEEEDNADDDAGKAEEEINELAATVITGGEGEGSIIIYCHTQNECDALKDILKSQGHSVDVYHAACTSAHRKRVLTQFSKNKLRILIATISLGMGFDKDDVRGVIHYSPPRSIENFLQEIGRAGRDGLGGESFVFLCDEEFVKLRSFAYGGGGDVGGVRKVIRAILGRGNETETASSSLPLQTRVERVVGVDLGELSVAADIKVEVIEVIVCFLEAKGLVEWMNRGVVKWKISLPSSSSVGGVNSSGSLIQSYLSSMFREQTDGVVNVAEVTQRALDFFAKQDQAKEKRGENEDEDESLKTSIDINSVQKDIERFVFEKRGEMSSLMQPGVGGRNNNNGNNNNNNAGETFNASAFMSSFHMRGGGRGRGGGGWRGGGGGRGWGRGRGGQNRFGSARWGGGNKWKNVKRGFGDKENEGEGLFVRVVANVEDEDGLVLEIYHKLKELEELNVSRVDALYALFTAAAAGRDGSKDGDDDAAAAEKKTKMTEDEAIRRIVEIEKQKEDEEAGRAVDFWGVAEEEDGAIIGERIDRYFEEGEDCLLGVEGQRRLPSFIRLKDGMERFVAADVVEFVRLHSDRVKTPRAVARILHGIASPAFPVAEWGRGGNANTWWGRHKSCDFRVLEGMALQALRRKLAKESGEKKEAE